MCTNTRNALGDHNVLQADTFSKCVFSNARYAAVIGDHACLTSRNQSFAFGVNQTVSCIMILGIILGNSNDRQTVTTRKCTDPDAVYTSADRDVGQIFTPCKSMIANARHAIRNHHTLQRRANREHSVSYACNTIGKSDAYQISTAIKCSVSNRRHAIRNDYRLDSTISKRLIANTCYTIRNTHRRQAIALEERPITDLRHSIGNSDAVHTIMHVKRIFANASDDVPIL